MTISEPGWRDGPRVEVDLPDLDLGGPVAEQAALETVQAGVEAEQVGGGDAK